MAQHFALLVAGVCSSQVHMMNGTRLSCTQAALASQPAQQDTHRAFFIITGMSIYRDGRGGVRTYQDKNT